MKHILSLLISSIFSLMAFSVPRFVSPASGSPIYTEQIRKLIEGYADMKQALIAPDTKAVQQSAQKFVKLATGFDATKLTPEEKALYETTVQGISQAAEMISTTTDLEVQREHFKEVSNQMVQLIIANRTTFADEDGAVQPVSTLAVEELRKPRERKMRKAVVLMEEGEKKICLRYCVEADGYYLSESKDDNPYLSKEKKK